jgi:ArsR family transcriptional regulator
LDSEDATALSNDLTLLGHPVRIQVLDILSRHEGEVCVCDVEAAVPVKQPTVSHHLRILREAGLVRVERKGVWAYYTVNRGAFEALRARMAEGLRRLG